MAVGVANPLTVIVPVWLPLTALVHVAKALFIVDRLATVAPFAAVTARLA